MSEITEKVRNYQGSNSFILKLKTSLEKWNRLTEKQIFVAEKIFKDEIDESTVRNVKWPVVGDTILVGRKVGQKLRNDYSLEFNPTILDITKVLGYTKTHIKFSGKMTSSRSKICVCCSRSLTDEFSMLTNMGKTCAKHLGIEYITDASQAEKFRQTYLNRISEIGEMEFWIPKRQIKKWEGDNSGILSVIQ